MLADLVDLGEVETAYGKKDRVRFVWLVEQRDSEGKPIAVVCAYNKSFHGKASLRKAIKAILGRDPGERYDIETLIGMNACLMIEHQTHDERTFASIAAMLKPRKGDTTLTIPRDFVRAQDRNGGAAGNAAKIAPPNGKNGAGPLSAKEAAPTKKRRTPTKAKVNNVHGVDVTDADVQIPGDQVA